MNDITTYCVAEAAPTGSIHIRSPYFEIVWTPIIGPTCIALVRALNLAAQSHTGTDLQLTIKQIAEIIGVSPSRAKRSLDRAGQHRLIQVFNNRLATSEYVDAPHRTRLNKQGHLTQHLAHRHHHDATVSTAPGDHT